MDEDNNIDNDVDGKDDDIDYGIDNDKEMIRYSGFVAIVGRPNVGKSTLLNQILGEKLSIISRKPQTTRHKILGIKTLDDRQAIFIDTPGLHLGEKRAINRYMNKEARSALKDIDVVLFVIEALVWTEEDDWVLKLLSKITQPVLLLVNKVDKVVDKNLLLPFIKNIESRRQFQEIFPISALEGGKQVEILVNKILHLLPEGPFYFPEDQVTDKPIRFRVSEIIREKLIQNLEDELPYSSTVEIEMFEEEERRYFISAIIWVERDGQKPIVVGKGGERLKKIGIQARRDLENLFDKPVHLKLWVKVKTSWSDDLRALKSLGYDTKN